MSLLLRFGFFFARLYWQVTQPISLGAAALILRNERSEVLLVRHTYRSGWALPGGGVKRGETVLEAVKREVYEEVGVVCNVDPELLSPPMYAQTDGKHDHKFIFCVTDWTIDVDAPASIEIKESKFFPVEELPETLGSGARKMLEIFSEGKRLGFHW